MSPKYTVNNVKEEIDQLNNKDRIGVHRIVSSRLIETERSLIAERAREAEGNYSHNRVRSGSVHDLLSELK